MCISLFTFCLISVVRLFHASTVCLLQTLILILWCKFLNTSVRCFQFPLSWVNGKDSIDFHKCRSRCEGLTSWYMCKQMKMFSTRKPTLRCQELLTYNKVFFLLFFFFCVCFFPAKIFSCWGHGAKLLSFTKLIKWLSTQSNI